MYLAISGTRALFKVRWARSVGHQSESGAGPQPVGVGGGDQADVDAQGLGAADALEAALNTESPSLESLTSGVELTLKQLNSVFQKFNVNEINPGAHYEHTIRATGVQIWDLIADYIIQETRNAATDN
jgi:hypothetical protein